MPNESEFTSLTFLQGSVLRRLAAGEDGLDEDAHGPARGVPPANHAEAQSLPPGALLVAGGEDVGEGGEAGGGGRRVGGGLALRPGSRDTCYTTRLLLCRHQLPAALQL